MVTFTGVGPYCAHFSTVGLIFPCALLLLFLIEITCGIHVQIRQIHNTTRKRGQFRPGNSWQIKLHQNRNFRNVVWKTYSKKQTLRNFKCHLKEEKLPILLVQILLLFVLKIHAFLHWWCHRMAKARQIHPRILKRKNNKIYTNRTGSIRLLFFLLSDLNTLPCAAINMQAIPCAVCQHAFFAMQPLSRVSYFV